MASRKRVPAAEARAGMKDLVDAVKNRNERIKITRYGKTVAYLVPAKDGEALENCAAELDECVRRQTIATTTIRTPSRNASAKTARKLTSKPKPAR